MLSKFLSDHSDVLIEFLSSGGKFAQAITAVVTYLTTKNVKNNSTKSRKRKRESKSMRKST